MKKFTILGLLFVFSGSSLATVAEDKIEARLERLSQEKMQQEFKQPAYQAHLLKRASLSESYPQKSNHHELTSGKQPTSNEYAGVTNKRKLLSETYIN